MDRFFQYISIFPMPLWLAMMLAPERKLTERASRSSTIFILSGIHYLLALIQTIRGAADEGDGRIPDFTTLDGISQGLGTRSGALGAWSHMVTLDLFTGAWIYRQCRRLGAPAWVRIPSLVLTMMSGPFGLLLFLLWRRAGAGQGEALADLVD